MRLRHHLLAAPLGAWAVAVPGQDAGSTSLSSGTSPPTTAGKTFSLGEEDNLDYTGGDAPIEMVRAHAKFTESLPPWVANVVASNPSMGDKFNTYVQQQGGVQEDDDDDDDTGTVPARPPRFFDLQYVVPVDIGTPPQRLHLNLDTGSSDLWAFSTDTYQPQVKSQPLYHPENSSTSQMQRGESWRVSYGDGAGASGIVYKDVVQLGETSFDKQAVQSAVDVSSDISNDEFSSGIIGMAMVGANKVRPTKQKTYIENIKDELEEPLFTVNLQKGRPGNYNFGYVNESEYTGEIEYTPIEEDSDFWKVPVSGYQVGDHEWRSYMWSGVVDTGTTLLLVPDDIVRDYYSKVNGAQKDPYVGMMTFPCSEEPPDFRFGIGGYKGTVPGHYINYAEARPGVCYGGIQSSEGLGMAIIGDVLIKSQFLVFNVGNHTVGFASKELPPDESKSPEPTPQPMAMPSQQPKPSAPGVGDVPS